MHTPALRFLDGLTPKPQPAAALPESRFDEGRFEYHDDCRPLSPEAALAVYEKDCKAVFSAMQAAGFENDKPDEFGHRRRFELSDACEAGIKTGGEPFCEADYSIGGTIVGTDAVEDFAAHIARILAHLTPGSWSIDVKGVRRIVTVR